MKKLLIEIWELLKDTYTDWTKAFTPIGKVVTFPLLIIVLICFSLMYPFNNEK